MATNIELKNMIEMLAAKIQEQDKKMEYLNEKLQETKFDLQKKEKKDIIKMADAKSADLGQWQGDADKQPFQAWSFGFVEFTASFNDDIRKLMEWAKDQTEEITEKKLEDDLELSDNKGIINNQLYTLLATKTAEEPKLIIQNTPAGMGLEAWRRINKRYDMKAKGMSNAGTKAIMKYAGEKNTDMKTLNHRIEKLEDMMRRYELTTKNKIVDDMKISLVTGMCPNTLEEHIELNSTNLNSYAKVRNEIMNYIVAKTAGNTAIDVSPLDEKYEDQQEDENWEHYIDALGYYNYYKGYASPGESKGKGGFWNAPKGKGKGEGDQKGDYGMKGEQKGKGKGKFSQIDCYNCGRKGHEAADCWSKGKGKGVDNFE
jgi:hypothetical protein